MLRLMKSLRKEPFEDPTGENWANVEGGSHAKNHRNLGQFLEKRFKYGNRIFQSKAVNV